MLEDRTSLLQGSINSAPEGATIDGNNELWYIENIWLKSDITVKNFKVLMIPSDETELTAFNIGHDLSEENGVANGTEAAEARTVSSTSPGHQNITIDNVHVDGNRALQTRVDYLTETDARRDGGKHGFCLKGYSNNVTIKNSSARYCATDGILIYNGLNTSSRDDTVQMHTNILIEDCDFSWNRRHGGAGDSINGLTVRRTTMNDNGQTIDGGLTVGNTGAQVPAGEYGNGWDMEGYGHGSRVTNVLFEDCEALRNVRDGILFFDPVDQDDEDFTFTARDLITIRRCELDYGTHNSNGNNALTFTSSIGNKALADVYEDVTIEDCTISGRFLLRSIDDVTIDDNDQTVPSGESYRAVLDYATNVVFSNNTTNQSSVFASDSSYTDND